MTHRLIYAATKSRQQITRS